MLIFVLSLFFMGLTVAVYATHKNWKKVVDNPTPNAARSEKLGLSQQLSQERTRNQELQDQKTRLEEDFEKQQLARQQKLSKLETEYDVLDREHTTLQQKQAKLIQQVREATGLVNANETRMKEQDQEIKALRADKLKAEQDRDAQFKRVLQLTDEQHQRVNELKRLKRREESLGADLAKVLQVTRLYRLNPDPAAHSDQPPLVDAIVLEATAEGLITISNGEDDGLRVGHKLHLHRNRKYVGRVEIVKVYPDRAVCRPEAGYLQSKPQRGDRVTSKQALPKP